MKIFKKALISILVIIIINFLIYFLPSYRLIKLSDIQSKRLVQDNNSNIMYQFVQIRQSGIDNKYYDNISNIMKTYQTLIKENGIAYNEGIIYYQILATLFLFITTIVEFKFKKKYIDVTLLFTSIVSLCILSLNLLQLYLSFQNVV